MRDSSAREVVTVLVVLAVAGVVLVWAIRAVTGTNPGPEPREVVGLLRQITL